MIIVLLAGWEMVMSAHELLLIHVIMSIYVIPKQNVNIYQKLQFVPVRMAGLVMVLEKMVVH